MYYRRPEVEALLADLVDLPFETLVCRARIISRESPDYVPSEVLVHKLRQTRDYKSDEHFGVIYHLLAQRICRTCPNKDIRHIGGEGEIGKHADIQEHVIERFVRLILKDRKTYENKLDVYEVVFDSAIKKLRISALRSINSKTKPLEPIEYDESGDVSANIEAGLEHLYPKNMTPEEEMTYRFQIRAAIDTLPEDERRLIDMQEAGYQDENKNPEAHTISKMLDRTPKTVRAMRERAYKKIRAQLGIEVQDVQ